MLNEEVDIEIDMKILTSDRAHKKLVLRSAVEVRKYLIFGGRGLSWMTSRRRETTTHARADDFLMSHAQTSHKGIDFELSSSDKKVVRTG